MVLILKLNLLWAAIVTLSISSPLLQNTASVETRSVNSHDYMNDEGWDNSERYNSTTNPPNAVTQMIVSRTGYFLRIGPDGLVSGTSNCRDEYVQMTTFGVGPSLFVIRGSESGLYLSMDGNGRISARKVSRKHIYYKDILKAMRMFPSQDRLK
ncbi:fibroblast growth factor 1-like [Anneissia japonica]|uniref:fibroblast growth factor 1-like n=1 Tax=Anneissia japonica TaxID=1529436 RepID=UPI001425A75C|nr:fibroblast growth factor 1-like [Anneissia japonica]